MPTGRPLVVRHGPSRDARRAHGHRGAVDAPGGERRAGHRLHRGVPAARGGLAAHEPELGPEVRPAQGVHVLAQPAGKRAPHLAVRPCPRAPAQERQLAGGAGGVGGRVAVRARVLGDDGPVAGGHRDGRGADPAHELASRERRVRGVEVRPVEPDLPRLVGLAHLVAHDRERHRRQPRHREPVLDEQLQLVLALDPVALVGERHRPVEQPRVERLGVLDPGQRHEQVVAHVADLVLDAAPLVAGMRVAERVGEPVVGGERREHLRRPHGVADPAADARGVVEHDALGHAGHVLEDVAQRLAHALGVLAGEDLRHPHVGVREGHDEEAHAPADAAHVEIGLAEVGLRIAWRPVEVEVLLALRAPLEPEAPHVVAHRRLADVGPGLVAQAHPDAVGGVALLAPVALVLVEPALYERAVAVERAGPAPRGRGPLRQVLRRQVLVDGVARHLELPGYLGDGIAVHPQLEYRIGFGHADHSFLASLVEYLSAMTKLADWVVGMFVSEVSKSCSAERRFLS